MERAQAIWNERGPEVSAGELAGFHAAYTYDHLSFGAFIHAADPALSRGL